MFGFSHFGTYMMDYKSVPINNSKSCGFFFKSTKYVAHSDSHSRVLRVQSIRVERLPTLLIIQTCASRVSLNKKVVILILTCRIGLLKIINFT